MVAEQLNMNIFKKINRVRIGLALQKIQKTGFNAHTNHRYYETADFLPVLNQLCEQEGLFLKKDFYEKFATLSVYNIDNTAEEPVIFKLEYLGDIASDSVRMANIQKYGAILTYLERYLYSKAFDITEDDVYDALRSEKPQLLQKLRGASTAEILEIIWLGLNEIYKEDSDLKKAYEARKAVLKPQAKPEPEKKPIEQILEKLQTVNTITELMDLWKQTPTTDQKKIGIYSLFSQKKIEILKEGE